MRVRYGPVSFCSYLKALSTNISFDLEVSSKLGGVEDPDELRGLRMRRGASEHVRNRESALGRARGARHGVGVRGRTRRVRELAHAPVPCYVRCARGARDRVSLDTLGFTLYGPWTLKDR